MGKNSSSQKRLLELGSGMGMDLAVEILDTVIKNGARNEWDRLIGKDLDYSNYDNVTSIKIKKAK